MWKRIPQLGVFIATISTFVLLQVSSPPLAAQGCTVTDPASGRVLTIPCPQPQPQPPGPQPEPREGPIQLPPPRVGEMPPTPPPTEPPKESELCTKKPTIDYFEGHRVGGVVSFKWKTHDAKSVSLNFVDAPAGSLSNLPPESEQHGQLSLFTGMTSAKLTAVCPPHETVATLLPNQVAQDPGWLNMCLGALIFWGFAGWLLRAVL
ncbi:MAG: hypothetical protein HY327_12525 [Chloroflexi bacterium]|nr:hypothetical protein [Chloroflexota bacterium]